MEVSPTEFLDEAVKYAANLSDEDEERFVSKYRENREKHGIRVSVYKAFIELYGEAELERLKK